MIINGLFQISFIFDIYDLSFTYQKKTVFQGQKLYLLFLFSSIKRIILNFMKCYTYHFILGNLINWTYLTACCVKENKEITLFS